MIAPDRSFINDADFRQGILLTHFIPIFAFYAPWKYEKASGFMIFSSGIKWEHSGVRGFEVGGKITPCPKIVRPMLET